jgi:hypothetical protein
MLMRIANEWLWLADAEEKSPEVADAASFGRPHRS